ncbi:MAG: hypothetical protein WBI17_07730 [Clostridiaceae bacterium]
MSFKKMMKILGISFITIILRSLLQLAIPAGNQTILEQSEFVKNGSLPMVFMLYGLFAFIALTLIFIEVQKGMGGKKHLKGLKIGILYSLIWTAFLIEPLPHGSFIDLFSYPLVDGIVLIFLGLMTGIFFSENTPNKTYQPNSETKFNIGIFTLFFTVGRLIQYNYFHIYSMFDSNPAKTLLWVVFTGVVIGFMFDYLNSAISIKEPIRKSLIFGGIYFGLNLFFFNFFLPLVLKVSLVDLITRTSIDIIFVLFACLLLNFRTSKVAVTAPN